MRFAALRQTGVQASLAAAIMFGAGTPLSKLLLENMNPWLLAGLLYTGSGIGLGLYRIIIRAPQVRISKGELAPLTGAIFFGGVVAPVLLMTGLANMPATGASLLLNAEGVFTALLAWFVFRENFDRRIAIGMISIAIGAIILSVPSGVTLGSILPSLAILGACLFWGLDNNLTRKVALTDATWLATIKGAVAGPVNLILAFSIGAQLPDIGSIGSAMVIGLFANGVSLVLFIVGMRHVGTARAGAYFSIAPFFGALLAVALGESFTWPLGVAAVFMAIGIWLHLTEQHEHEHKHTAETHDHWHNHSDNHHAHEHSAEDGQYELAGLRTGSRHKHSHSHEATAHSHDHYPDSHHRHEH